MLSDNAPHRAIAADDIAAAQRGLGMVGKSPTELDALAATYANSPDFAGQVIRQAALQMAAAKRRVGAA